MGCPNSTESGCRCPEHAPGLSVHAQDAAAYNRALDRCRPTQVRLSVVTLGPGADSEPCTNTMLCPCTDCQAATAYLAKRGGQGSGNASPFKVRKAA